MNSEETCNKTIVPYEERSWLLQSPASVEEDSQIMDTTVETEGKNGQVSATGFSSMMSEMYMTADVRENVQDHFADLSLDYGVTVRTIGEQTIVTCREDEHPSNIETNFDNILPANMKSENSAYYDRPSGLLQTSASVGEYATESLPADVENSSDNTIEGHHTSSNDVKEFISADGLRTSIEETIVAQGEDEHPHNLFTITNNNERHLPTINYQDNPFTHTQSPPDKTDIGIERATSSGNTVVHSDLKLPSSSTSVISTDVSYKDKIIKQQDDVIASQERKLEYQQMMLGKKNQEIASLRQDNIILKLQNEENYKLPESLSSSKGPLPKEQLPEGNAVQRDELNRAKASLLQHIRPDVLEDINRRKKEPMKLLGFILHTVFKDIDLGDSCAKGRSSRPALPTEKLTPILDYIQARFPSIEMRRLITKVNETCSDSRKKRKKNQEETTSVLMKKTKT